MQVMLECCGVSRGWKFPVHHRFHPTSVGWNLWGTRELPSPKLADICTGFSLPVGQSFINLSPRRKSESAYRVSQIFQALACHYRHWKFIFDIHWVRCSQAHLVYISTQNDPKYFIFKRCFCDIVRIFWLGLVWCHFQHHMVYIETFLPLHYHEIQRWWPSTLY